MGDIFVHSKLIVIYQANQSCWTHFRFGSQHNPHDSLYRERHLKKPKPLRLSEWVLFLLNLLLKRCSKSQCDANQKLYTAFAMTKIQSETDGSPEAHHGHS